MNTATAAAPKKGKGLHPAIKSVTSTGHKTTEIKAVKKAKTNPGVQIGHPVAKAAAEADSAPKGGKKAQAMADAQAGKLPEAPDFSANTHARFRGRLDKIVALVKAGDIKALKAEVINPVSSSPKALARYRDLAVIALEAQAAAGKGAKAAPAKAEPHPDDAGLTAAEKKLAGIPVEEAQPI